MSYYKKICCFAGHGKYDLNNDKIEQLYELCQNLILNEYVSEFWVGNYGLFDKTVAKVIRDIKNKYTGGELCLVIPYLTKVINNYKENFYNDYDDIIIADIPKSTPKRYHIIKCNQYMVDNSDFLISYVNYNGGGAARTLNYALRQKHIKIYNIGQLKVD